MNTSGTRTVNVTINGATLLADGVRWQTNGDTALAQTALSTLGNSFTTTIGFQTMQLFLLTPAPPGDFDHNGVVNGADLDLWRTSYGVDAGGDADGDQDTDGADFLVWQRQLGVGEAVAAASNVVPEPETVLLLAGLLLSQTAPGRRRNAR
jgi:hypothetical protein